MQIKKTSDITLRLSKLLLSLFFLCALCACNEEELLSGLNSKQAVEVMVALKRAGIYASRSTSGSGRTSSYSVHVSPENYQSALEVIHEYNLPSTEPESIEKLTKSDGFIPNTREMSSLRLDHVLALQVERMLIALPGVIEVRVTVRSNLVGDRFQEKRETPSASVVIRYEGESSKIPFSLREVQETVEQIVPDIDSSNIRVVVSKIKDMQTLEAGGSVDGLQAGESLTQLAPFSFRVPESEKRAAMTQIAWAVLLLIVAAAIVFTSFGWSFAYRKVRKRYAELGSKKAELLIEESAGKE